MFAILSDNFKASVPSALNLRVRVPLLSSSVYPKLDIALLLSSGTHAGSTQPAAVYTISPSEKRETTGQPVVCGFLALKPGCFLFGAESWGDNGRVRVTLEAVYRCDVASAPCGGRWRPRDARDSIRLRRTTGGGRYAGMRALQPWCYPPELSRTHNLPPWIRRLDCGA